MKSSGNLARCAFNGLLQRLCLNSIELRKIAVEHDLLPANAINVTFDVFTGIGTCGSMPAPQL